MQDVVVGVLAILAGALFCFRGYFALRLVIPIWGAFAGFLLGAGVVASAADQGFLRSAMAWMVGLAAAAVFGLFAYLYYAVSVVFAMGAVGFALGTGVMVALGVSWSWVIVLVGVAVGLALAVVAILADAPVLLLILVSAPAGATAIVGGLMLLVGVVDTSEFTAGATTERLDDGWWWYVSYAVLVVAGLVAQLRSAERLRGTLREEWADQKASRSGLSGTPAGSPT